MTISVDGHVFFSESPVPPTGHFADARYLEAMQTQFTAEEQIRDLRAKMHEYLYRDETTRTDAAGMFADLAASVDGDTPAVVRVEALECALQLGHAAPLYGTTAMEILQRRMDGQFPFYGANQAAQQRGLSYSWISKQMLEAAGAPRSIYFPENSIDAIGVESDYPDHNPGLVYDYLDRLHDELAGPDPSVEAKRFAPLIDEVQSTLASHVGYKGRVDVPFSSWTDVMTCSRYFQHGNNYAAQFTELLNLPGEDKLAYMRELSRLQSMVGADIGSRAFPDRYAQTVKQSLGNLLADAAYAVHHHLTNGNRTDASLSLGGATGDLPLHLTGDEPLVLLHALAQALNGVDEVRLSKASVKAIEGDGFTMYRFLDKRYNAEHYRVLPVSLYVRPYGSRTFDTALEYGRRDEGVEASININVDISGETEDPIELGKHRGTGEDTRVSIRLDREGVKKDERGERGRHDPTQEEGMLSLDVGSIIGDDDWLSTKLGRFLAWGNQLRTQAQREYTDWNHIRVHFTDEDGNAAVFAAEAKAMIAAVEAKRISPENAGGLLISRTLLQGIIQ